MKEVNSLLALMLVVSMMAMPTLAFAQACPGTNNYVTMNLAKMAGMNDTTTTMFVGAGCTSTPVGATGMVKPLNCATSTTTMGTKHVFSANFYNESWRLMAGTTGGCSFMCGPGNSNSCFVRANDGLPVELMEFNVDE